MACRLVNACAGTTNNERMNYMDKRTRHDQRSNLSYVQTESLVIINKFVNATPRNIVADLARLRMYAYKFSNLSDMEEADVDALHEKLKEEETQTVETAVVEESIDASNDDEIDSRSNVRVANDISLFKNRSSARRNKGNRYKLLLEKVKDMGLFEGDGSEGSGNDEDYAA